MNNKLEKNAKLLLINDLFYSVTGIFLSTFLVAYFLKITEKNIFIISMFYIIFYMLVGLGIFFINRYIKKEPKLGKPFIFIGVCLRALFILSIVLIGSRISNYYILIAILYSVSEIFYWSSHEIIYVDVTNNHNRRKFNSANKILSKISSIIFPVLIGASIELYSFLKIAVYVLIISILQIITIILINKNTKKIITTRKKI